MDDTTYSSPELEQFEETEQLLFEIRKGEATMARYARAFDEVDLYSGPEEYTPERNLIASILERAIFDLSAPERHVRLDAERWFFSEETGVLSFQWVLNILNIASAAARIHVKITQLISNREVLVGQKYRHNNLGKMWKELNPK